MVTVTPAGLPPSDGASRISRYTPALTMVEEWSMADTGVGATMAPSSQPENGICADLVRAAPAMRNTTRPIMGVCLMASSDSRSPTW